MFGFLIVFELFCILVIVLEKGQGGAVEGIDSQLSLIGFGVGIVIGFGLCFVKGLHSVS